MRKALFLVAIGAVFYRLVPHPPNAVPMGALALYAGACLPRRWAWLVPVAAMGLSDFVIDWTIGRPFFDVSRWIIYATMGATTLLGPIANRPKFGRLLLPVLSLSASTLFFLTSNFAAWLVPEMGYPRTPAGLFAAYTLGIPFVRNTILADLAGTVVLFGLGALLARVPRVLPAAEPEREPAGTPPVG
jgi:hypothetical protein